MKNDESCEECDFVDKHIKYIKDYLKSEGLEDIELEGLFIAGACLSVVERGVTAEEWLDLVARLTATMYPDYKPNS